MIQDSRIDLDKLPYLYRVVVAIDPAVTFRESSDETGIIVAGASADGHFYVLEDKSLKSSPDTWARVAIDALRRNKGDRIIAETNNGGDLVLEVLKQVDSSAPLKKVITSRGKRVRAEPIAALFEQGRVHMVGNFPLLEEQMVSWNPESTESPDRMDALVWAITELSTSNSAMRYLASIAIFCPECRYPNSKRTSHCFSCRKLLPAP